MSTQLETTRIYSSADETIVDPAVFAAQLVSRETLERVQMPDQDLVGLRNARTGETMYVRESRLNRWMQARG